ncbi:hypothetical protein BDN72DRAFT_151859 [Pluteus cervinus]|uniref:Uncharacterized protein n=1 Tax=Pluteus cervinus TaxID=181527 RepID=A0ACD3B613_9AGAR|nr:hypothetical protein BDN72DRAFT_151859 [Pluteus cervinus]
MASANAFSLSLVLQALSVIQASRYTVVAACTLQVYDWLLLLEDEIKFIHQSAEWTCIRIIFILARYYPLLAWPVIVWALVPNHAPAFCANVLWPIHIIHAPLQCIAQFVMLFRAYAFTGRARCVLYCLGSLYLILVGVDLWAFCARVIAPAAAFYTLVGDTGCFADYNNEMMRLRLGFIMLAATLMDLASLVVVFCYCRRYQAEKTSLGRVFIQQGMCAFAALLVVNAIAAIIYFRPEPIHNGSGYPIMFVLSNIFACRVILHLRKQTSLTDSEMAQRDDALVRSAFGVLTQDEWAIGGNEKTSIMENGLPP